MYLEGENASYDFPLVPLGETVFFDRKHGGTVRFERENARAPWTLVYHFGRDWRALKLTSNEE